MKFGKIQIELSKLVNQFIWVYLTLLALQHFHQPLILSTEATPVPVTTPQPPSPSSLLGLARKTFAAPTVTSAPYVRKSRDTGGASATSAPEYIDGQEQFVNLAPSSHISSSGGHFFPYPSFKHKYQTRVARFHGGGGEHPATRTYSIRSMTSFPKLNPLAGMLSMKSNEIRYPTVPEELENESQDPTFTPFISARALSNIPQFFQHLRDNLEALQLDEDDLEGDDNGDSYKGDRLMGQSADTLFPYGNDEEEVRSLNIPRPQEKPMRWMPSTAGMTGRAHIRHFINDPADLDLFLKKPAYNPGRNAYEFGLG